jgi:hypothetical protein
MFQGQPTYSLGIMSFFQATVLYGGHVIDLGVVHRPKLVWSRFKQGSPDKDFKRLKRASQKSRQSLLGVQGLNGVGGDLFVCSSVMPFSNV